MRRGAAPAAGRDEQVAGLLDRIESRVADRQVREVSMFGAVAVMVDDAMLVAVSKDGSLLVRVDPSRGAELTERPDAAQAVMGEGRSMGPGWLRVDAASAADDAALDFWVACALQRTAAQRPEPRSSS